MIAPIESTRSGNAITVRFEDGTVAELPCPPALIGNPIARLLVDIERWRTRPTRPWQLLDCPPEHAADLRELLASMPEGEQYLSIEPGWYGLVAEAWREAKAVNAGVRCVEVKEKRGELRVYLRDENLGLSGQFGAVQQRALVASERTCEWCAGETGAEPGYGHPSRLCVDCRDFSARWDAAWREAGA